MESTTAKVPAKRRRIEGHKRTQLAQETMLEVLLWLNRFDLDGKQITTRRLRSLVENKQIPLRYVDRVSYNGERLGYPDPPAKSTLSVGLEKDKPAKVELDIETDEDAQKAASYLSSCFVRAFCLFGHEDALPKNVIIAAPALIHMLDFRFCDFYNGEGDTLSETLGGSTFQNLSILYSYIPAWQFDDTRLESLRLRGCNDVHVCPNTGELNDNEDKFEVTEEGMLSYCFTLDDGLPLPGKRTLEITCVKITPAFFKKVVEASKTSRVTCDVELRLHGLQFDVGNLGVGVPPSHTSEYDQMTEAHMRNVCYNIPDHGNGIRLLIHFKSEHGQEWNVVVRHGKKEDGKFFEPRQEEEEYWEYEPDLDDRGDWY